MSERKHIKVTYSTLASPDPLLHQYFEEAVEEAKAGFGKTFPMFINGEERSAAETFEKRSPVDLDLVMGHFQYGTAVDVNDAVANTVGALLGAGYLRWRSRRERSAGSTKVA